VQSSESTPPSIIFAAGGTAGHVEPALATADAIRQRDPAAHISFLGTPRGIENQLVPPRGYELITVPKAAIPRGLSKDLLLLPVRLFRAVAQTKRAIFGADVVVGFGGYLAGAAYLAARLSRIPIVLHEANTKAGLANRLGAMFTDQIVLGGPTNGLADGVVIGLPMREAILRAAEVMQTDASGGRAAARRALGLDSEKATLVVMGGSQGSVKINNAVAAALDRLLASGFQILHSVGDRNEMPAAKPGYIPTPYLAKMELAYSAADVLLARSGAATCHEVVAFGLPAIFVPLPHGNGEQALNAAPLVAVGAAICIDDEKFDADLLVDQILGLFKDSDTLSRMHLGSAKLIRLSAASDLAAIVIRVADESKSIRGIR
jgi:UDP-N-acetylglucosamine--N-acetylmuramyl-(pentapeptide) pyrophosphoryl-undecaprenol N-acetylglucosamine transferase